MRPCIHPLKMRCAGRKVLHRDYRSRIFLVTSKVTDTLAVARPKVELMKRLLLILFTVVCFSFPVQGKPNPEVKRWELEARNVTIIRDDWGIAHVYGKTDADAVFGMEYAQAEDDFNRVET